MLLDNIFLLHRNRSILYLVIIIFHILPLLFFQQSSCVMLENCKDTKGTGLYFEDKRFSYKIYRQ